jgi:hypothetical protein
VHTPVAASVERDIQVTINPSDVRIFPAENIQGPYTTPREA